MSPRYQITTLLSPRQPPGGSVIQQDSEELRVMNMDEEHDHAKVWERWRLL